MKGTSLLVNNILGYIEKSTLQEIENYCFVQSKEDYVVFQNREEARSAIRPILSEYLKSLDLQEMENLKRYTGYQFRNLNSLLRGIWDYDLNGKLTDQLKQELEILSKRIRKTILKAPILPMPLKVFRGVSLSTFSSYHISTLSELKEMEGKFFCDQAFTSTTLIREESFFYKQTEWGEKANIEIEYLIPSQSDDGVFLMNDATSFSPNQCEFLINNFSLFRVLDVKVDEATNTAKITMILIPQKIWNKLDYDMERQQLKEDYLKRGNIHISFVLIPSVILFLGILISVILYYFM